MNSSFMKDVTMDYQKNIQAFVQKLIIYSEKNELSFIDGLVAFGSIAKNDLKLYSDVNLAIIYHSKGLKKIKSQILSIFRKELIYKIDEPKKLIIFLPLEIGSQEKSLRIEIIFLKRVKQIKKYILGSNLVLNDLNTIILVENNIEIKNIINKFLVKNEDIKKAKYRKKFILRAVNKFIDNFERVSSKFDKTDTYATFFHLEECYHVLVKLESLVHDNTVGLFNYLPDKAFNLIDEETVFPFYKKNIPKISILETTNLRKSYYSKFIKLLYQLESKYNLHLEISKISDFLLFQIEKNYFWNVRDISYVNPKRIAPNKIFRSSTLSRYNSDPELDKFISKYDIKSIIDIRSEDEIKLQPYSEDFKNQDVKYIHIPIGKKDIDEELEKLPLHEMTRQETFYDIFPRFYGQEINNILKSLMDAEFPALIHCYAGKDRTGMIIAILLALLGIGKDKILEDYLNTGNDTSIKQFEIFQGVIDEYGGIDDFMEKIGFNNENKLKLSHKILLK